MNLYLFLVLISAPILFFPAMVLKIYSCGADGNQLQPASEYSATLFLLVAAYSASFGIISIGIRVSVMSAHASQHFVNVRK